MSEFKPRPLSPGSGVPAEARCLDTGRDVPGVFLRFESKRQRVALPYAGLLKVELSEDDTEIELNFATHQVKVCGKHLRRIYEAVSQARAVQITVAREDFPIEAMTRTDTPYVTEIRIEPLDEAERRRR